MDRETTINYMRKAVACHNEDNTICLSRNCLDCPHDYPIDNIELIESAFKLLEQDRWHSVAKEGNPKESGFYLWTSKDGTVREDYYQVRDDTWSKAWQFGYKVVAWKKEPEPYTEGNNDK